MSGDWTENQLARRAQIEAGQTVVASLRKGVDEPLIAWARKAGLFVLVDRKTKWGNLYVIPQDGDRDEVIAKHRNYLERSPELLADLGDLKGRLLACWCHPQACHGHTLAARCNEAGR